MLPASFGRHVAERALNQLEQGLLDAFSRDVPRDRRALRLPADLVDLVDVDDPVLGPFHVVIGRLQQLEHHILDVLADIAGLREGRRVGDRKRDFQDPRQRLAEEGFPRAGRPDQDHIALLKLHIADPGASLNAAVMIVHGHGEDFFGLLLSDHVVVQQALALRRIEQLEDRWPGSPGGRSALGDHRLAAGHAFIADPEGGGAVTRFAEIGSRTFDELDRPSPRLPAKGAVQLFGRAILFVAPPKHGTPSGPSIIAGGSGETQPAFRYGSWAVSDVP